MKQIYTLESLDILTVMLYKKKIVLAGGCFDLLHLGHIIFLQKAKQQGQVLVVLLESDETIKKLKGTGRPIHTQEVRAQILAELRSVDFVLMLPPMDSDQKYDELIKELKPDIIATTEGDEYDFHKKRQAEKFEAEVVYVTKPIEDHSTTKIIQNMKAHQRIS